MKIQILDHNFFEEKVIASYLIENGGEPVLIETGPDTTFHTLEKKLRDVGYSVQDIKNVFVTHIHLDHSGGAWHFANAGATIHVHPLGAKHLADPEKLIASATRIYGDQMDTLWGEIQPVPGDKIVEIHDGDKISVGNMEIQAVETQGHASHHHAYLIDGVIFAGDIAGICIEDGPVLPPTPPPEINVELWQESIRKILDLNPDTLYPTHFGKSEHPEDRLKELESRLLDATEWIGDRMKEGKTEEEMIPAFEDKFKSILVDAGADSQLIKTYEMADPFYMNVGGLIRYWKKFRS